MFSGVHQGRRGQGSNGLEADGCFVGFEPKTVENRPRNGATLVEDCVMRGAIVGMGDGDVKMEGSVGRDVNVGAGWCLFVDPSAPQLRKSFPQRCRCRPV